MKGKARNEIARNVIDEDAKHSYATKKINPIVPRLCVEVCRWLNAAFVLRGRHLVISLDIQMSWRCLACLLLDAESNLLLLHLS